MWLMVDDCSAAASFGSASDVTALSFIGLEHMSRQERASFL